MPDNKTDIHTKVADIEIDNRIMCTVMKILAFAVWLQWGLLAVLSFPLIAAWLGW